MHLSYRLYLYYSPLLGMSSILIDLGFGAAYGTAKSGVGIASMGVLRPDLIIKNVVPVIMAGIIGIYGLVVSSLALHIPTQPSRSSHLYSIHTLC